MSEDSGATHLTLRAARARAGVTMHKLTQMVENGEVEGIKVVTESGHTRTQVSIESLDRWKAGQAARKAAA